MSSGRWATRRGTGTAHPACDYWQNTGFWRHEAIVEELDRRLKGSTEPLGLLTHHLVHDRATWVFLDELLAEIAHHPGIVWPEPRQMFGV